MAKTTIQIHGDYDLFRLNDLLTKAELPVVVEVKPLRQGRSLSQNALFHMWCNEMAEQFTQRERRQNGKKATIYFPEDIKAILKHLLLGYEDVRIGRTTIKGQLKSTADLDMGEMHHFLTQVDAWAVEHGVQLTYPDDSEYAKTKRNQNQMV